MKKNLLITAALLVAITLFTNKAKAQGNTAKVTIHLANAASIIMGANKDITFNYTTAADYAAAKDSTLNAHFTVISNTPYTINATTSTAFIDGSNSIALDVLRIQVATTDIANGISSYTAITPVASTLTPLVTSAIPTTSTAYNVKYSIPNAGGLIGKPAGNYVTNIVYSVTQL